MNTQRYQPGGRLRAELPRIAREKAENRRKLQDVVDLCRAKIAALKQQPLVDHDEIAKLEDIAADCERTIES